MNNAKDTFLQCNDVILVANIQALSELIMSIPFLFIKILFNHVKMRFSIENPLHGKSFLLI